MSIQTPLPPPQIFPASAASAVPGGGPGGVPGFWDGVLGAAGLAETDAVQALAAWREAPGDESPAVVCVAKGLVDEEELLSALAVAAGLDVWLRIPAEALDPELVRGLPIAYLKRNLALPLRQAEQGAVLAMFDPTRVEAADEIRRVLGLVRLPVVLAPQAEILTAIGRTYGQADESSDTIIRDVDQGLADRFFAGIEDVSGGDLLEETSEAPIIKLVNMIIAKAVKSRASDIHVEPYSDELKVRYRLDGVLHNVHSLPRKLHAAVLSRIKVMARLDIAEKRLPQDGRMEIKLGDRSVDIRVSLIPTSDGERAVLRLLEKQSRVLGLEDLGFGPGALADMRRLVSFSHGMILLTGPTGSGKTTTLYAALNSINSPDKNILTIEDPVEYRLPGVGQMQVNPKIDLDFAAGLRSLVRQDPDVIMIGEVRDRETADIAVQASLTGHLVFSTLHTNDAPTGVARLLDMGVESFRLASCLRAIIAQRLVRVLCPECKSARMPSDEELAEMRLTREQAPGTICSPAGCELCLGTGYRGRTAIHEILLLSEAVQEMILTTSDANRLRHLAVTEGMTTLREAGIAKVLAGITTLAEVRRATLV
ncbi:type II secretion system ATPase GspE [Desulfolutivibrio sp.]|uniref:type II secretion system ATPase GspE n=1 Tax=Desulfolutivibrio sp. TaxID=2773296 RepID=UPI002F963126